MTLKTSKEEVIFDTCLSISDMSDKTINELKQEIKRIESDNRLTNRAKAVLINEAEKGIKKFKSIKKKFKDYCLYAEDVDVSEVNEPRRESEEPGTMRYF